MITINLLKSGLIDIKKVLDFETIEKENGAKVLNHGQINDIYQIIENTIDKINLVAGTYDSLVERNKELQKENRELRQKIKAAKSLIRKLANLSEKINEDYNYGR